MDVFFFQIIEDFWFRLTEIDIRFGFFRSKYNALNKKRKKL